MHYCLVICLVSSTNQIYHLAASRLGDKYDRSMTLGITRQYCTAFHFYFLNIHYYDIDTSMARRGWKPTLFIAFTLMILYSNFASSPRFATSTTLQTSSWIAILGHADGIPSSLPQRDDRFYYSLTRDRSVPEICTSWEMLSHPNVSHPLGWDNIFVPSFRAMMSNAHL